MEWVMPPFMSAGAPVPRRHLPAPGPQPQPMLPPGTFTCPQCQRKTLEERFVQALRVCPSCGHHARVPASERLMQLADADTLTTVPLDFPIVDPLAFDDGVPYRERVLKARTSTGLGDAFAVGTCTIGGHPVVVAAMEFSFFGGSLGQSAGDSFLRACSIARDEHRALIAVCTSGGARMQEGIVSLSQMARCSAGVVALGHENLPYITVLTDPCYGGVTASFATQGDVIIAEPHARIGFAGGRVIEQATYDKLPHGFQTAEFLLAHGMLDAVVARAMLQKTLGTTLAALTHHEVMNRG